MAYDEELAGRIRSLLDKRDDVVETTMFGGLAFLINGNMAVAASGQGGLLVRCDPADSDDHIVAGADPMIMRGRPVTGWLRVGADLTRTAENVRRWASIGVTHAEALPAK